MCRSDGAILVASRSFVLWDGGRMVRFLRGKTTIREGHRLLEGNEDRFKPFVVDFELPADPTDDELEPAPAASDPTSTQTAEPQADGQSNDGQSTDGEDESDDA